MQKFDGHHGEVWALAVSHLGEFVVSGPHDKLVHVWEKTEEPVSSAFTQSGGRLTSLDSFFLDEEQERYQSKCTNPTLQIP
jgi:WD40 repeat protein